MKRIRTIESLMLEKTAVVILSNHQPGGKKKQTAMEAEEVRSALLNFELYLLHYVRSHCCDQET